MTTTTISRQEFNFVMANWGPNGMATVFSAGKTVRLEVDYSKPITVSRCKEVLDAAKKLTGRNDIRKIKLCHKIYTKTPGNECGDWAEQCLLDMEYEYDSRRNELVIFDRGEVVYINADGEILRGDDAHVAWCDCVELR